MASNNSISLRPAAGGIALVGGGKLTEVADYKDGQRVGVQTRNGVPLRRAAGVTALMDGVPLDGFTVTTTAQLDEIPDGSLLAASGVVEVNIRGEAKPGFGDGGPRASLTGSVFVEQIEAVGSMATLLAQAASRRGKSD
ncbi:hypothetical protein [Leucobacter chromiireducens]|uniref:hypothetical protein n=1 Tax=Leucobacter chromiireducens TaxID=283877 RepID=UPI000F62E41A|nr:hypothetical protein [Leucobacter chromiireducens]